MIIEQSTRWLLPLGTGGSGREKPAEEARQVAGEFAALFYRRLLEEAGPSSLAGSTGSFWWETFSGEIAREITRSSPLTEFFYLRLNRELKNK